MHRLRREDEDMDVETFLTEIIPIKDQELKRILKEECIIESFQRGEQINKIGEIDKYIRFLITGAVIGFIPDKNGKKITTGISTNPGDAISGARMLDGGPNEIGFGEIKDCEVFSIPADTVIRLRTQFQEISDLHVLVLAQAASYHWETKKMLYMKTAKERYEWFLEQYPGMIDCVSHRDIASFLNITPVTLSRIRHGKG
jgi:CRP-like cAMP-binding protein